MKEFNNTKIIGIDHGYGNMLSKGKYNPDKIQKLTILK